MWNPRFIRSFNDWEMELAHNFIGLVNNKKVNPFDKGHINLEGSQRWFFFFTVEANFNHLESETLPLVLVKVLWNPCVPTKVGFFGRESWWGKVLTMEQMKKRGHQLASRCLLCGRDEEGLEHLLID